MRYEISFNGEFSCHEILNEGAVSACPSNETFQKKKSLSDSFSAHAATKLSPEVAVLLAAVSPFHSLKHLQDRVQHLSPLEWKRFEEIASVQGLLLLTKPRLSGLSPTPPLREFLQGVRKKYFTALRKNLFVDNLTVQVSILLSGAGLPTLLFKGTPFIRQFYGDLGLQECNEVNVLIHPDHARRAEEILRTIGFRRAARQEILADKTCLVMKQNIGGLDCRVTIHWDFPSAHAVRFPLEALWRTATPYTHSAASDLNWKEHDQRLIRPNVFALSPEFQWLYFSFDLAFNRYQKWLGYADLCQTFLVYDSILNGDRLCCLIDRFGLRKIVLRGLTFAQAWGLRLPQSFIERIRPSFPKALLDWPLRNKSLIRSTNSFPFPISG